MIRDIILIGPVKAGKSTLGRLLSAKLGLPQCSLDRHLGYYKDAGFDDTYADHIIGEQGFAGLYRYRNSFDLAVVERVLAEHGNSVFDFGACHSVYEDDELRSRARRLLRDYRNVVLILPSPDADESIRVLKGRGRIGSIDGFDLYAHFVKHVSNFELAKYVVYTEGNTPEQTCDEILSVTGLAENNRRVVGSQRRALSSYGQLSGGDARCRRCASRFEVE